MRPVTRVLLSVSTIVVRVRIGYHTCAPTRTAPTASILGLPELTCRPSPTAFISGWPKSLFRIGSKRFASLRVVQVTLLLHGLVPRFGMGRLTNCALFLELNNNINYD